MNLQNLVPMLGPVLALCLVVFSIVMTIAWIIVPFAIIGTKPILREILAELRAPRSSAGGQQEPRF